METKETRPHIVIASLRDNTFWGLSGEMNLTWQLDSGRTSSGWVSRCMRVCVCA